MNVWSCLSARRKCHTRVPQLSKVELHYDARLDEKLVG